MSDRSGTRPIGDKFFQTEIFLWTLRRTLNSSQTHSTSRTLVFLMPSSFSFGFDDDDIDQDTLGDKVPEGETHADEKEDGVSMPPKLHSCLELVGSTHVILISHFLPHAMFWQCLRLKLRDLWHRLPRDPLTLSYAILMSAK